MIECSLRVHACVRVCLCACVYMRVCARACVRACVCVRACARMCVCVYVVRYFFTSANCEN